MQTYVNDNESYTKILHNNYQVCRFAEIYNGTDSEERDRPYNPDTYSYTHIYQPVRM